MGPERTDSHRGRLHPGGQAPLGFFARHRPLPLPWRLRVAVGAEARQHPANDEGDDCSQDWQQKLRSWICEGKGPVHDVADAAADGRSAPSMWHGEESANLAGQAGSALIVSPLGSGA